MWSKVIAVLLALAASTALAQTQPRSSQPSPEALRASDEARERGVQFMKEERYADALRAFSEAHKLAPAPRTAAQKGLAEQAMHLWLPAEAHITLALENADDPWIKKNRVFLEEAAREIGSHIGSLALEFMKPIDGARITAAGEWIPWSPPGLVRLPEGEIALEIRAEGYATWRRTVAIRPGAVLHIPVELSAGSTPATPAGPLMNVGVAHPVTRPAKAPTWAVAAIAAVAIGAAGYGTYLISVDGDPACGGSGVCPKTRTTRVPGMLLVGAGAALGVGSFVFATWRRSANDRTAVSLGISGVNVHF